MDRVFNLVSRQRASLSSPSTSHPNRMANDSKTNSNIGSDSGTSVPVHPVHSSQDTAQCQPNQAQTTATGSTEACETKKKSGKNKKTKKRNKASTHEASTGRLESNQKLFDMAEALINQYEDISNTGHDLYRQLGEAALEVLEANKYIRCKEQEVVEISKRLWALEKSFKEAEEHLDEARLISCHVSLDLLETQINYKLDIQLLDNFKNMINDARRSEISAWSEKDTHSYLKDLLATHVVNKDVAYSTSISKNILSIAKLLTYYGNYDFDDALLLFHLANGHDVQGFLRQCHDEDHEMASRYPVDHVYRARKKKAKEPEFRMEKTVADLIQKYAKGLTPSQLESHPAPVAMVDKFSHKAMVDAPITVSHKILDPLPFGKLDEFMAQPQPGVVVRCAVPGCRCEEMEKGEFKNWMVKLHGTLSRKQSWGMEADRVPLYDTVDAICQAARHFGIDVSLLLVEGGRVPAIMFLYSKRDHPTKSPESRGILQAFAEAFCFHFGTCEHGGKGGYVVTPAYRMLNNVVMLEMHTHVRMGIYYVIQEEVDEFMRKNWGGSPTEADKSRKDALGKQLEVLASQYYFPLTSQILGEDGKIANTFRSELACMLKNRFLVSIVKQDGLHCCLPKKA